MTAAAPSRTRIRRRFRSRRRPVAFLAPFGVFFLVFFVAPIVYAAYESLLSTHRSGLGIGPSTTVFSGLANYAAAFADQGFVNSILRILLFTVVQVPVMVLLSLILALILDSASARFEGLFRAAYFAPYGVPGVIASLLWGFLYAPGISPIVSVINSAGLHVNFLGSGSTLWSILNIVTWEFAGYNILIIIAQLQSIPRDLYEAAHVDGASTWRVAWHIKVPLVRPALVLTSVFTIIGSLQLFAEPLVLQPIDSNISNTYTPNLAAYSEAFTYNNYNVAAAEAVVLALAAVVLSFTFLKLTQRRGG